MTDIIKAFNDVEDKGLPVKEGIAGDTYLNNLLGLQVGAGSEVFRSDSSGIWLGASKFIDAPFSVDMDGNLIATSSSISGYILVGGAAADVNGGATTISGGKITATSIAADRLNVATLSAISANLGTITAGSMSGIDIAIGTGNNIFKADANGIYLGNATFASAPFRVTMGGDITATSATISGKITSGAGSAYTGNAIAETYIGNLSASKITSGTIYVGGGSEPAAIYIRQGTISDSAKLRWDGGSRIWEDTSNRMGINSIGSPMYLYINSHEQCVFPDGGQTTMRHGVYCDGNLNVVNDARFDGYLYGQGTTGKMKFDGEHIRLYNDANTLEVSIHLDDGGKIYTDKDQINLGGHTLTLTGDVSLP